MNSNDNNNNNKIKLLIIIMTAIYDLKNVVMGM